MNNDKQKIIITNIYGNEIKKGLIAYVKSIGFAFLYRLDIFNNLAYFRWQNEERGFFYIKLRELKKIINNSEVFF